ncbi:SHOCT domain-containing protein [Agromyces sp. MMS24-K17]|uniref:SHOCT domain-containing protein n=1 Tax=Agromyces sp. MMS24-K17 TaxID=3372850 RepID=UPI003754413B
MNFWQSFWEIVWWTIWIFAFIAYLWAVIAIITDLFRDHKLNGWLKAVWIIFLLFFPFITALVYLIARGNSMAERAQKEAVQVQQATDAYIRQTAGTSASPSDEIAKAKALLDSGSITPQEYEALKAKALSHS